MRVLVNKPEQTLVRGVASLLGQALAASPGEVWLVSPWLKDVRFPVGDAGPFRPLLGGLPQQMTLSELLRRLAARHRVTLITKPPAELVNLDEIRRIGEKLDVRGRLSADAELRGRGVVEELTEVLLADARGSARSATAHAETIRIGLELSAAGSDVFYLEKLHAKLLWTPGGSLVGSANSTNGGMFANDELMLEVTDGEAHAALLESAKAMALRATRRGSYSPRRPMERAGVTAERLRQLRDAAEVSAVPGWTALIEMLERFSPPAAQAGVGGR